MVKTMVNNEKNTDIKNKNTIFIKNSIDNANDMSSNSSTSLGIAAEYQHLSILKHGRSSSQ